MRIGVRYRHGARSLPLYAFTTGARNWTWTLGAARLSVRCRPFPAVASSPDLNRDDQAHRQPCGGDCYRLLLLHSTAAEGPMSAKTRPFREHRGRTVVGSAGHMTCSLRPQLSTANPLVLRCLLLVLPDVYFWRIQYWSSIPPTFKLLPYRTSAAPLHPDYCGVQRLLALVGPFSKS